MTKIEEVKLKLNSALFFFSENNYKRSLEDLKIVGDIVSEARNKEIREKNRIEFKKKNVELPLM